MVDAKLLTVIALVIVVGASLGSTYLRQSNSENGTAATSVYLKGKLTSEGQPTLSIEIFYTENPDLENIGGARSKFSVEAEGGGVYTTDIDAAAVFAYDADGDLTGCHDVNAEDTAHITALVNSETVVSAGNGDLSEFEGVYNGNAFTFTVEAATIGSDGIEISTPTLEECMVVGLVRDESPRDQDLSQEERDEKLMDSGRRRLLEGGTWGKTTSHSQLWKTSQMAYEWQDMLMGMQDGWSMWKECKGANMEGNFLMGSARAIFLYKDGVMTLNIAGTDPHEIGDILADADFRKETYSESPQITGHSGFFNHMEQISGCMNDGVDELASRDIPISHLVGHSLGGASVVAYVQAHGKMEGRATPTRELGELVTFGAPKSRFSDIDNAAHCSVPGVRYFNENDPIAGPAFGLFAGLFHDVDTAYQLEKKCTRKSWFGGCREYAFTKSLARCDKETEQCETMFDFPFCVTFNLVGYLFSHVLSYGDYDL